MDKRLAIVATEQNSESPKPQKQNKRQMTQAKFDRLWLEDPSQFDPERNGMEKERLARTFELILRHIDLKGKKVVDLGCGHGVLAKMLAAEGATVDAVDISPLALKPLKSEPIANIRPVQDYIPQTLLEDDAYDLVISTEVLGYLPEEDRRLYFAELARLVKPEGLVVCSNGLDIYTENPLEAFAALAETEFQILEWVYSYNGFYIKLKKIPVLKGFLNNNRRLLLWLEKLCQAVNSDGGLSNAIFIGKRRPMLPQEQERPPETLPNQKKRVWE